MNPVDNIPAASPGPGRHEINSVMGIARFLDRGLAGLHELIELRRRLARKNEGQQRTYLDEYVVLGLFVLDQFGQVAVIRNEIPPALRRRVLSEDGRVLPWKGDMPDSYMKALDRYGVDVVCTSFDLDLPKETDRCARCEGKWTFENITDVVYYRQSAPGAQWWHRECNAYRWFEEERLRLLNACTKAGLRVQSMSATPNQYWGSCNPPPWKTPWFFVETIECGKLLIGSRKRVDVIDWSRSPQELGPQPHLFDDQNVTKNDYSVHAWNEEKLVEYLARLKHAAGHR